MKDFLFVFSPYISHILPTTGIARHLKKQGYSILYAAPKRFKEVIANQGFNHYEIDELKDKEDAKLLSASIEKLIHQFKIVGCFVEVGKWDWSILLNAKGIPTIALEIGISENKSRFVPPFNVFFIPKKNLFSLVKMEWQWRKIFFKLFSSFKDNKKHESYYKDILTLTCKTGQELLSRKNRIYNYMLIGEPELILFPHEYNFNLTPADQSEYIGGFVDHLRKEKPFDWHKIDLTKPLIFCCFGSLSGWFKSAGRLFEKIITAFEDNKNYTLIICIGNHLPELIASHLSDHIHIFKSVPQLEILKKTAVFINHGGSGSVRESLCLGVPMLIYPWSKDSDMLGNSSRVAYHGLGIVGDIVSDTPSKILSYVEKLQDYPFSKNINEMQKTFNNYNSRERFFIQQIIEIFKTNQGSNE